MNNIQKDPRTVPVQEFLPKQEDKDRVNPAMQTMVKRVLVLAIPHMEELTDEVEWHIEHDYSEVCISQKQYY